MRNAVQVDAGVWAWQEQATYSIGDGGWHGVGDQLPNELVRELGLDVEPVHRREPVRVLDVADVLAVFDAMPFGREAILEDPGGLLDYCLEYGDVMTEPTATEAIRQYRERGGEQLALATEGA